ncbi:ATP-grasp domain-containing protein [Kitasatospora sp. MY 5-36]|uniref:ATP-grasp domain-containing protein n=1 Tax=Kitasatospora sp. MY 5-36 TaxID=1678027 RepID=UPI000670C1D6|nr:ATP-grasp domain-containing protein [Kitasatospora sp. MY 5-36]
MNTPDPAELRRILVTGIGGAPGLDLALTLLKLGHEVIGTDSNPLAPGLLAPGITGRTIARADSPLFAADLMELVHDLKPDALICCVENELPQLVHLRGHLERAGVRTWLPPAASVTTAGDKWEFHQAMRAARVPTPQTWLPDRIGQTPDGTELVVKPRRGQGSKDVHFCRTREQARVLCELVPAPIVQQRVRGVEFSADCLTDRNGRTSAILRQRLMVQAGMSMVAVTIDDPEATKRVAEAIRAIGAVGPVDVQGFITEGADPRVVITEINARFAAGFLLAEEAGADLVRQTLNGLFQQPVDHRRLTYRGGVFLTKYVAVMSTESRAVSGTL